MADEAPVAEELFYLDSAGDKQDADLHNAIINPVDFPIDEKIMGPIRAKHREAYLAPGQAKVRSLRWQRIRAKALAGSLVKGHNGLYRGWNEQDHPRHPAGSAQGGEFEGPGGKTDPERGGPPEASAGGLPRSYARESPSDAQRSRGVVAIWRPTPAAADQITAAGHTPQTFYEFNKGGAKSFQNAIARAKDAATYGASVHVYDADIYKGMRLFMSSSGEAGFALKGDDIVSLFKHPGSNTKGIADVALKLAVEEGGRRLDAFDTVLPQTYANAGFTPVARLKWNEAYKPEGWDKQTFKQFNNGEPDVVFMVRDPGAAKNYVKGDGAYVEDYDAGTDAQLDALRRFSPGLKTTPGSSFENATTVKAGWIATSTVKTIEDVKIRATEGQKVLGDVGQQIAAKYGLEFKDPGPKTKTEKGVQRVLEKAAERDGNLAAVSDTARATFLVDHPEQTDKIIAELAKHFEVAAEPWKVTKMNYGDRAVNVRLPNGVIAEIQMMHPAMAYAKSPEGGGGHDLYKISRETAPGGITPDPVQYADAMAKQRELYGKVYEGLSDDWKAAFGKAGKSG